MADGFQRSRNAHFWRYTLIGALTLAPLWVTWLVFDLILGLLYRAGAPWVSALARLVRPVSDSLADWLLLPAFNFVLAVLITVLTLYLAGWLASQVVGKRLLAAFEAIVGRIPIASAIYNATKRFIASMREKPAELQRVVLINFPSPEMKAVGFVTRVMADQETGRELAAVYVPTFPNPTSGYIEIVPLENVTATDWSIEEAMAFVMTGGANAPDTVRFRAAGEAGRPR